MKKIALKRLTKSDLTFFNWHFQHGNSGNQKAINLNADVFVTKLFPFLPEEAARRGDRFVIELDIYGPGGQPGLNQARKIVKGDSYKNWRLNGEVVRDEEQRFRPLREGDLALFEFEGDAFPSAARMVLISGELSADAEAHKELDAWLGARRMAQIKPEQLDSIVGGIAIGDSHPLRSINLQNELEDAAQGGAAAAERIFKRRGTRTVSRAELKSARNQADETGAIGEEFVNEWLNSEQSAGRISKFEWTSRENAIAPFDFTVTPHTAVLERLDVKATSGPFRNPIHLSANELMHCADDVPYRIYRVFDIDGPNAKLRISEPLAALAATIIPILAALPEGVSADGISIDPRVLSFGPEISIELNSVSIE